MPVKVDDLEIPDFTDAQKEKLPIRLVDTTPRRSKLWTDKDGHPWIIGVGLDRTSSGEAVYCKQRKFTYDDPRDCEESDLGHEVFPPFWPPVREARWVDKVKVETPGSMPLTCEHCGINVIVDEQMLARIQDGDLRGYRITLPTGKKEKKSHAPTSAA